MVISFELEQFMKKNNYTLEECAKEIGVSVSTIKKWLYYKQSPSKRMLKKLYSIPRFFSWKETEKMNPEEVNTMANQLAQMSESYKVTRLPNGKVKVEMEFLAEMFNQPINLNINYDDTQRILNKHHYVVTDNDIKIGED